MYISASLGHPYGVAQHCLAFPVAGRRMLKSILQGLQISTLPDNFHS
jgi:hypothetical protein